VEELQEIEAVWTQADDIALNFEALAIDDEYYLHPGNWPQDKSG